MTYGDWLLLLGVWATANFTWTLLNWREHREIGKMYTDAVQFVESAKKVAAAAQIQAQHVPCPVCKRITTQHVTHDDGVTRCVNCHADMLNGYAMGVKIG